MASSWASWCAATVVLVFAVGCQSYESGVQLACESPRHCPDCPQAAGETRVKALQAYVDKHLRNDEARAAFTKSFAGPPEDVASSLRKTAKDAGIAGCLLADVVEASRKTSDPPSADDGPK